YRAGTLRTISLDRVESTGYCFQIDLTLRVARAGLRIVEVPITFVEREHGASKMTNKIILEAFWRGAQWGVARGLGRVGTVGARRRGGRDRGRGPVGWRTGAGLRLSAPALRAGVLRGVRTPPLPDDLEPLGEHGLEVLDRAALHEHVPVTARRLG